MASNLGNILSLFLIIPLMIFIGDLIGIQTAYNQLENLCTQITFSIQQKGCLSDEMIQFITDTYHVNVDYETNLEHNFGEYLNFSIYKYYEGIIISGNDLVIRINRTVLLGYFD